MLTPAFGPEALTPLAFLERSAVVYGHRTAMIDGDRRFDYRELRDRCLRLSGALAARGIEAGDRVSVLAPNSHLALEAHFGVPASGAVLNALNIRLAVDELVHIVDHAGSKMLIADADYRDVARTVADRCDHPVQVVDGGGPDSTYEQMLASADLLLRPVVDEWSLLSLNYTSGTTGRPKGVMYAHRGAYLQSLAMAAQAGLDAATVFLWTLPMFHCNGWCYPWAVTAVGGTHVGLREVKPDTIWAAITDRGVTHFNAAPTVLTMLADHPLAHRISTPVRVATGGAPPSPTLLARLDRLNIAVTHLYGLTETYGPR